VRSLPSVRIMAATLFAMMAFAANSILCRLALRGDLIDAAGFTAIRLVSGAAALWLLLVLWGRRAGRSGGATARGRPRAATWISAFWLFLYALAFSLAYRDLAIGTGALILFGMVQVTMILAGLRLGERPDSRQWLGVAIAIGGLVLLVLPGLGAPTPRGAALMGLAGFAWGVYSLRGRTNSDPLVITTANFACTLPYVLIAGLAASAGLLAARQPTARGIVLAVLSGALASGLGYVAWYMALPGLRATQAAVVQLSAPVLAALGGVLLLYERTSPRLLVAAAAILGGLGLVLRERARKVAS
jgi:drug/metabolite transporter (DMT)-like permease